MQASLGDRLIVESPVTGFVRCDGRSSAFVTTTGHRRTTCAGRTQATSRWSSPGWTPTFTTPVRSGRYRTRRCRAIRPPGRRTPEPSPVPLNYLKTHPSDPDFEPLLRLADALGTTLLELRGGGREQPPGQGTLPPRLWDLREQECWALLSTHGMGRISLTTPCGLAVFPVNYKVADGVIVFRAAPDAAPAATAGREVAFEADHVDETMSQGWSVLAVGRARAVTEPDEARQFDERAHTEPWAGDRRTLWVVIAVDRLTERRIIPADDVSSPTTAALIVTETSGARQGPFGPDTSGGTTVNRKVSDRRRGKSADREPR